MTTKKPKVSIIILTWNQKKLTLSQLKDVAKLDTKNIDSEVFVVDNGSVDGTEESLKDYKLSNMSFRYLNTGSNLGFAGGNNAGLRKIKGEGFDYIILMNNDLVLQKDLLVKLVEVAEKDKKIGLLAPKMYFAKGYEFHKKRYKKSELGNVLWYAGGMLDENNIYSTHRGVDEVDKGQYENEENTDVANGACVLIRVKMMKEIGLLKEKYFLYWEDADYSERARRAGWRVVYTPKTHLWHMVSQASGIGSKLNDYFLTRNRLDFGLRYGKLRTKLALVKESLTMLRKGREWQKIGVKDFYLRKFGKGSWGKQK